jgi:hypothetical protein
LPRMPFSSAMDATPTAPLRTPRTSCTSRSSPAAASTPTKASTSRTSTPTPAVSKTGCDHSRASHPGICRATLAGAAPLSGSVKTSRPSAVFRPRIAAVQHEGRTEPISSTARNTNAPIA